MGFTTARLSAREIEQHDLAWYQDFHLTPELTQYMVFSFETLESTKQFFYQGIDDQAKPERSLYQFAVRDNSTGSIIGIGLLGIRPHEPESVEVGYVIFKQYWGQGYATEITKGLHGFVFSTLGKHRAWGKCDEHNPASARVMEKSGMQFEGITREHVFLRGKWRNSKVYSLLEHEWAEAK